jgi:hypothetical protein
MTSERLLGKRTLIELDGEALYCFSLLMDVGKDASKQGLAS